MKRNPVLVVLWKNKVGMCSRSSAIRGIFTAVGSIGIGKPSSFVLALSLLFWNCANHGERAIPPSGQALCRHWSKFLASVKILLIMGYTNSSHVRSRVLSTIGRYHHPRFHVSGHRGPVRLNDVSPDALPVHVLSKALVCAALAWSEWLEAHGMKRTHYLFRLFISRASAFLIFTF